MPAGQKTRGEDLLTPKVCPRERRPMLTGRLQEARWVLRGSVQAHFEVQVRTGRAPARPDSRDPLATEDQIALLHKKRGIVSIPAHKAVAVVDLDHLTIRRMCLRVDDLPAGRCNNRGARF